MINNKFRVNSPTSAVCLYPYFYKARHFHNTWFIVFLFCFVFVTLYCFICCPCFFKDPFILWQFLCRAAIESVVFWEYNYLLSVTSAEDLYFSCCKVIYWMGIRNHLPHPRLSAINCKKRNKKLETKNRENCMLFLLSNNML